MKRLSKPEKQILKFTLNKLSSGEASREVGIPPVELMAQCFGNMHGTLSNYVVKRATDSLRKRGFIEPVPKPKGRGWRLTDKGAKQTMKLLVEQSY